jgi:hypothetical protein
LYFLNQACIWPQPTREVAGHFAIGDFHFHIAHGEAVAVGLDDVGPHRAPVMAAETVMKPRRENDAAFVLVSPMTSDVSWDPARVMDFLRLVREAHSANKRCRKQITSLRGSLALGRPGTASRSETGYGPSVRATRRLI